MNANDAREYTDDCKLYNVICCIKEACKAERYELEISPSITDILLLNKLKRLKYQITTQKDTTIIRW